MQLLVMKQDRGAYFKGDIVEVRATGTPFGGLEPNDFVLIEVPSVPMADYEQYRRKWERSIEFEVVNQDAAQDGYRLRLYSANANGALGAIARADVEQFVASWGGTVHSFDVNEVVFDIRIYDALVSPAFWGNSLSGIQFSEVSYDQGTGIHRVEADCSALGNSPTYVERYVARRALNLITVGDFEVVSHENRVLTFDADRAVAKAVFEQDIWYKSSRTVAKRRYHVSDGVVDYIVGQGGTVSTDVPTLAGYIQDKMTE